MLTSFLTRRNLNATTINIQIKRFHDRKIFERKTTKIDLFFMLIDERNKKI